VIRPALLLFAGWICVGGQAQAAGSVHLTVGHAEFAGLSVEGLEVGLTQEAGVAGIATLRADTS